MARQAGDLFPPDLRPRYEPIQLLGQGAMGMIFLAREVSFDRLVAVKILKQELDPEFQRRFERSVHSLSRLHHPNVIEIYVFGECQDGHYLVMEYLKGRSLDQVLHLEDPLDFMLQIARGMEAAHQVDLVHRDLKPANLFLTQDGRAVLVDFDLVYDPRRTRTREGMLVGTLGYLPPELLQGLTTPGPATDWYAWGITLFQLLEDRLPYDEDILFEVLRGTPLPPPEFESLAPDSPPARLIRGCLDPHPKKRIHRLSDALHLLETGQLPLESSSARPLRPSEVLPSASSRASNWFPLLSSLGLVLAGLFGGFFLGYSPKPEPESTGARVEVQAPPEFSQWVSHIAREFEAAQDLYLDPQGSIRKLGPEDSLQGMRSVLSPDPSLVPVRKKAIPALSRSLEFLGKPTSLPPGLLKQVQELDRRFQRFGLEPPLAPFWGLPAPEDFSASRLETKLRTWRRAEERDPDEEDGWGPAAPPNFGPHGRRLGLQLERVADEAIDLIQRYEAHLTGTSPPDESEAMRRLFEGIPGRVTGALRFSEFAANQAAGSATLRRVQTLVRPGALAYRRLAYLVGEVLRSEPDSRVFALALLAHPFQRAWYFFRSELAYMSPPELFGPLPEEILSDFAHSVLLETRSRIRDPLNDRKNPEYQHLMRLCRSASALPTQGPYAMFYSVNLRRHYNVAKRHFDIPEMLWILSRTLARNPDPFPWDPSQLEVVVNLGLMVDGFVALDALDAIPEPERARCLELFRAYRDSTKFQRVVPNRERSLNRLSNREDFRPSPSGSASDGK